MLGRIEQGRGAGFESRFCFDFLHFFAWLIFEVDFFTSYVPNYSMSCCILIPHLSSSEEAIQSSCNVQLDSTCLSASSSSSVA